VRDDRHYTGYVLTSNGDYLVQISDNDAKTGYFIVDKSGKRYDGGNGITAREWKTVNEKEVPRDTRMELQWAFETYEIPGDARRMCASVRRNDALLDACEGTHDFLRYSSNGLASRYRCTKCGGDVSVIAKMWYEKGVKDAGYQKGKKKKI
jgi:hypothetical protein